MSRSSVPAPGPVRMAPGYGADVKRRYLAWSFAETRLRRAHNYWLCTTRPDGRPHAAPMWGLWSASERAFLFSTDPASQKGKNLAHCPSVVVHVESGSEVVIVEGRAEACELTKAIDAAYFKKYASHLIGFPGPSAIYRVRAEVVMAWREAKFPASTTRWVFEG